MDEKNTSGFVLDKLKKLKKKKTQVDLLDKYTVVKDGVRSFDLTNSKLAATTDSEQIKQNWDKYIQSLSSAFVTSAGSSYFTIKDIARRLNSGLGSQGVDKFYVLIEGKSSSIDDDEILEVKEEGLPSLFNEGSSSLSQYSSRFSTDAERVVIAKKVLGIKVDEHLGSMTFNGKSFRVARISLYKDEFESSDFKSKSDVDDFVKYAAKALALAHARSDKDFNRKAIDDLSEFKTTVNNLSEVYYDQVNADYKMFLDIISSKQLK